MAKEITARRNLIRYINGRVFLALLYNFSKICNTEDLTEISNLNTGIYVRILTYFQQ